MGGPKRLWCEGKVIMQSLYEQGQARVQVAGKESCPFQVWKGVRQGCPLSPWLFNIFIDRIVSEARNMFYGSVQLTTGEVEAVRQVIEKVIE